MELICQPGDQLFNLQDNKLYTIVGLKGETGFDCADSNGNPISFDIRNTSFQKVVS